jgi:hypothetical protein
LHFNNIKGGLAGHTVTLAALGMRENLGVDSKIFIYQVVLALIMKDKVFLLIFLEKVFYCTLFSFKFKAFKFSIKNNT